MCRDGSARGNRWYPSERLQTMSPRSSSSRSSRRGPRRWFRRVIIGLLVLANLAVLAVLWTLRTADTTLRESATQVEEVVAELSPTPEKEEPITFLVIGSDSREGLDDLRHFADVGGQRADVIMLVQVLPESGKVQILSIPRDLYVDIEGRGRNRINAAYAYGGAQLMVKTVKDVIGVPIHHYVEVDFVGFRSIVDELGGVVVDFPFPARDLQSGLAVEAGRQVLDGEQALALARSRSYQELRDGKWVAVDASDLGRTRRQQQLVFAILSTLKRPSTLTGVGDLVEAFAQYLTIDSALADRGILDLAFKMRDLTPADIEATTLPVVGRTIDGRSVVVPQEPAFSAVVEAFRDGTSLSAPVEGPLRLVVLNGNGVPGAAARWRDALQQQGFDVTRIGDADSSDFTETVVIVRPGEIPRGRTVVEALGFGTVTAGTVEANVDAVVIVGEDAVPQASAG